MAKILYVASRVPFPKLGGREYMIAQSLEFLSSIHDVTVVVFRRDQDEFADKELLSLGVTSILYIDVPTIYNLLLNFLLRFSHSIQENYTFQSL